jgi:hypothetical protein
MKKGEKRGSKTAAIWTWLSSQPRPEETSYDLYIHAKGEVCSRDLFSKARLRYLVYVGKMKMSGISEAAQKIQIPPGFPKVHEPKVAKKAKKAANGEHRMAALQEENEYLKWVLYGERRGFVHRVLQEEGGE